MIKTTSNGAQNTPSPENFSYYLHSINLRSWYILLIVFLLITGSCVWAYFSYFDMKLTTVAVAENHTLTVYLNAEDKGQIDGAILGVDGKEFRMDAEMLADEPVRADYGFSDWMLAQAEFARGEWVYPASLTTADIPDGIYTVKLTIDRISPLSLIFG